MPKGVRGVKDQMHTFSTSLDKWSLSILGGWGFEKNGHYFPFSSDAELYLRSLKLDAHNNAAAIRF